MPQALTSRVDITLSSIDNLHYMYPLSTTVTAGIHRSVPWLCISIVVYPPGWKLYVYASKNRFPLPNFAHRWTSASTQSTESHILIGIHSSAIAATNDIHLPRANLPRQLISDLLPIIT